jgi:hypothetical protein
MGQCIDPGYLYSDTGDGLGQHSLNAGLPLAHSAQCPEDNNSAARDSTGHVSVI